MPWRSYCRLSKLALLCLLNWTLWGQETPTLQQLAERLERVEAENRRLAALVEKLSQQLPAASPAVETDAPVAPVLPLPERVAIQERRVEEQAQAKVEASQRLPIKITGMALFNAFVNSRNNGGLENPGVASLASQPTTSGATVRQTVLGLQFNSLPSVVGARVTGSLEMDFFGGTTAALNHVMRLRVANIHLDWKHQTLSFGQDKPLISVRDPSSLAQVGVSPLTGAGNLWFWQPQVRFEQRVGSGANRVRAQVALYQTNETASNVPAEYAAELGRSRPAWQGRVELSHRWDDDRRIEIAPGFHYSLTHLGDSSVPSRLVSLDWLVVPHRRVRFSGLFYHGQNVANMGTGLRQGVSILRDGRIIPVHGNGGWGQLALTLTDRLTWNLFTGQQDDRNRDLLFGGIGKNQALGSNLMYRLAPNVIMSFEALQLRTDYLGQGRRLHNHYDLAVAYLF